MTSSIIQLRRIQVAFTQSERSNMPEASNHLWRFIARKIIYWICSKPGDPYIHRFIMVPSKVAIFETNPYVNYRYRVISIHDSTEDVGCDATTIHVFLTEKKTILWSNFWTLLNVFRTWNTHHDWLVFWHFFEPRSRYPRPEWCMASVGSIPKTSEISMVFRWVQLQKQRQNQLKSATKGLWFIQTCVRAFATWASQLRTQLSDALNHLQLIWFFEINGNQAMNQKETSHLCGSLLGSRWFKRV